MVVDQCRWGHPARKRTLLYIVGPKGYPPIPPWREPTRYATGSSRGHKGLPEGQRHLTPLAFARWLVELARRGYEN